MTNYPSSALIKEVAQIQQERQRLYKEVSDPMFFMVQAGEVSQEAWQQQREQIKLDNPYPDEWLDLNPQPSPPTDEQLAAEARTMRNQLLADSDWTQLPDARNAMGADKAAEWDTYRQDLRDITAQAGFPREIEWPTKPE